MQIVARAVLKSVFGALRPLDPETEEVSLRRIVRGADVLEIGSFECEIPEDDEERMGLSMPVGVIVAAEERDF